MTTLSAARDAINAQFKTAWDAGTAPLNAGTPFAIYWDGAESTTLPPGDKTWARVTIRHNTGSQQTFGPTGGRSFNRLGVIIVQVFVPAQEGLTLADVLATIVRSAFEGKHATADSGVWFHHARVNEVGPDGPWYQVNVLVEFVYEELL
jgi:hypothetical protein